MHPEEFANAIDGDRAQAKAFKDFDQLHRQEQLPLWSRWGSIGRGASGSTYSALIVNSQVTDALKQPGWDVRIEGHRPGFSEGYVGGKRQVSYEPVNSEGVEPLVHVRLAVERFPIDYIFPEEFLLLFDLHRAEKRELVLD